jgi:hypothetical protein
MAQALPLMVSLLVDSSEVSTEWVSSLTPELAMVPSDVPPVFVVRQGVPMITNVAPSFGDSFGVADVGSGSSSTIRQISSMSIPASPVVASLSQANALASEAVDFVSSGVYLSGEPSVQGKGGFFSCGDRSYPFFGVCRCSC